MAAEREVQHGPENKVGIAQVVLDTEEIIGRTITFKSLDDQLREGMSGTNFSPQRYLAGPPEVVRVYDNTRPEGFRYEVIAGHHRIEGARSFIALRHTAPDAYAKRLRDQGLEKFDPVANDMTEEELEKFSGQRHLRESQLLERLTDPEKAHEALAPERVSSYIMHTWDNMVGAEVSETFPALPALLKITMADVSAHTPVMLRRYLKAPDPSVFSDIESRNTVMFAGETMDQRKSVENAFIEIAEVMQKRDVAYPDVIEDTFHLVQKNSDAMKDQIEGFLGYPEVVAKIENGADSEEQDVRRAQLIDVINQRFGKLTVMREISAFYKALVDPELPHKYLVEFLESNDEKTLVQKLPRMHELIRADRVIDTHFVESEDRERIESEHPWLRKLIRESLNPRSVLNLFDRVPATLSQAEAALAALPPGDSTRRNILRGIINSVTNANTVNEMRSHLIRLEQALHTRPADEHRRTSPPAPPPDRRGGYVPTGRPTGFQPVSERRGARPPAPPARPVASSDPRGTEPTTALASTTSIPRTEPPVSRVVHHPDIVNDEDGLTEVEVYFQTIAALMKKPGRLKLDEILLLEGAAARLNGRITRERERTQTPTTVFSHADSDADPTLRTGAPEVNVPTGLTEDQLRIRDRLQGHLNSNHTIGHIATTLGITRGSVVRLFESVALQPPTN